jgi:hypothetical protein
LGFLGKKQKVLGVWEYERESEKERLCSVNCIAYLVVESVKFLVFLITCVFSVHTRFR